MQTDRRSASCLGALVGGNWNNALKCGPRYVNLNNLASQTNANIWSRHSIPKLEILSLCIIAPRRWAKIKPVKGSD